MADPTRRRWPAVVVAFLLSAILAGSAWWSHQRFLSASVRAEFYEEFAASVASLEQLVPLWSVEVARVRDTTDAHFDELLRLRRRSQDISREMESSLQLLAPVSQELRFLTLGLTAQIDGLRSSVEHFKTNFAIVRNAQKHIPRDAAILIEAASAAGDTDLERLVRTLSELATSLTGHRSAAAGRSLPPMLSRLDGLTRGTHLESTAVKLAGHLQALASKAPRLQHRYEEIMQLPIGDAVTDLSGRISDLSGDEATVRRLYGHASTALVGLLIFYWVTLLLRPVFSAWSAQRTRPSPAKEADTAMPPTTSPAPPAPEAPAPAPVAPGSTGVPAFSAHSPAPPPARGATLEERLAGLGPPPPSPPADEPPPLPEAPAAEPPPPAEPPVPVATAPDPFQLPEPPSAELDETPPAPADGLPSAPLPAPAGAFAPSGGDGLPAPEGFAPDPAPSFPEPAAEAPAVPAPAAARAPEPPAAPSGPSPFDPPAPVFAPGVPPAFLRESAAPEPAPAAVPAPLPAQTPADGLVDWAAFRVFATRLEAVSRLMGTADHLPPEAAPAILQTCPALIDDLAREVHGWAGQAPAFAPGPASDLSGLLGVPGELFPESVSLRVPAGLTTGLPEPMLRACLSALAAWFEARAPGAASQALAACPGPQGPTLLATSTGQQAQAPGVAFSGDVLGVLCEAASVRVDTHAGSGAASLVLTFPGAA